MPQDIKMADRMRQVCLKKITHSVIFSNQNSGGIHTELYKFVWNILRDMVTWVRNIARTWDSSKWLTR